MKKILCIIFSFLILISITILPVSAADATEDTTHGGSSGSIDDNTGTLEGVNSFSYRNWNDYLSNLDLSHIELSEDYDYTLPGFVVFHNDSKYFNSFFNSNFDYEFYWDEADEDHRYIGVTMGNDFKVCINGYLNDVYGLSCENVTYDYTTFLNSEDLIIIVDNIDDYNLINTSYFKGQVFYNPEPVQTIVDYINASKYDDMFYDVYPMSSGSKNIIRFYDCFDSYYGKYQYDFYEDNMLNYLNSSYSLNTELYCKPSKISTGDQIEAGDLQHNEMYNIYIPVPDDFEVDNANAYLSSIGSAIHYEQGNIDFGTWYSTYIKPWLDKYNASSKFTVITLKDVEPSTKEYPTVNTSDTKKDVKLLRLLFPSYYTFVESSQDDGGMIMSGCRTMSTASIVDIENGTIENSASNGIGADIDGGDYVDDKDYDELIADGWKKGYPNTASYPYKITVNKNGYVLYEFYFDTKPNSIISNYYSDSQISYDIDFNLTRGYIYAKQQNCYLPFDFRSEQEDDWLSSDGSITDSITDSEEFRNLLLRIGLVSVSPIIGGSISDSVVDYYNNYQLQLRLWTNYTGQLHGTYRGYYTQFNWDLELDDNFIKSNSDDTHNYTDDYLQDDGFIDNNGNIHGGAVELPTDDPAYGGFNNSDFSFDENNLWDYADMFLGFCYRAFKVLPEFLWQLIGCGIVIIIILRVLGR